MGGDASGYQNDTQERRVYPQARGCNGGEDLEIFPGVYSTGGVAYVETHNPTERTRLYRKAQERRLYCYPYTLTCSEKQRA